MVYVDYSSLNRFSSPFVQLSENFLYPSALAFGKCALSLAFSKYALIFGGYLHWADSSNIFSWYLAFNLRII